MTEDQKIRLELNKKGMDLLEMNDDYDEIREDGLVGFAHYYLRQSWHKTARVNKANVKVYEELVKIDNQLGTKMSEQLFYCVFWSFRLDLVKV